MTPTDPHPPTPAATGDELAAAPVPLMCMPVDDRTDGQKLEDAINGACCALDTLREMAEAMAKLENENKQLRNNLKDANRRAREYRRTPPPAPEVPEGGTGGEGLFRQWCGNSYEWDALTDVERQRWHRLANSTEARLRAVTAERDGEKEHHKFYRNKVSDFMGVNQELAAALTAARAERDGLKADVARLTSLGDPQALLDSIENLAAERDAAVAERDGLRDAAKNAELMWRNHVYFQRVKARKAFAQEQGHSCECRKACQSIADSTDVVPDYEAYIASLTTELTTLRASLAAARADGEMLKALRELAGYVEDGSSQSVTFFQDDATKTWFIKAGKREYFDSSFAAAITAAMKGEGE